MQLNELKLLSSLIHSYGVDEVKRIIDSNIEFLNYLNNSEKNILYSEENNIQTFTNCESSVFFLNEKTLDYDLIKDKIILENLDNQKILEYINKSKIWFGKNYSKATLIKYSGVVISCNTAINTISTLDAKLIELLLGKPEVYASKQNPVLYAESEKGYAYVLGKQHENQLKF